MDKITEGMKKMNISVKQPPKLKCCKRCPYNIGDDKTGLCASCDPNYVCNPEKRIRELQHLHIPEQVTRESGLGKDLET